MPTAGEKQNVLAYSLETTLATQTRWQHDSSIHKLHFVPNPGYCSTRLDAIVPRILAKESGVQVVACQPGLRECNALRAACKGQLVQSSTLSHVEHLCVASCVVGVAQGARACESCVQFAVCARLMAICHHFGSAICLFLMATVHFGFKLLECFDGEPLWVVRSGNPS